jgi:hypothetical protein
MDPKEFEINEMKSIHISKERSVSETGSVSVLRLGGGEHLLFLAC